jgi:hypothetical protein
MLFPGRRMFPVKVGEARFALRFKAVVRVPFTGLFASDVLSTFPSPTIVFVIPVAFEKVAVPVKVGFAGGAF